MNTLKSLLVLPLVFLTINCVETKSCIQEHVSSNVHPTESFVKIEQVVKKDNEVLGIFVGSGSVMKVTENETFILTVKHICEQPLEFIIAGNAGNEIVLIAYDIDNVAHIAELKTKSILYDLCLLKISTNIGKPALTFSKKPPTNRQKVYNMAAPLNIFDNHMVPIYDGYYAGDFKTSESGVRVSGFTIPIQTGSSGSPILNENMEVVGIVTRKHQNFENFAVSTTYDQLEEFLKTNL